MGDPITSLGTAVGIVSLGIQACQGLVTYYASFRTFESDINSLVRRLEVLQNTLGVLNDVIKRVKTPGDHVSQYVLQVLVSLNNEIQELERSRKKCETIYERA